MTVFNIFSHILALEGSPLGQSQSSGYHIPVQKSYIAETSGRLCDDRVNPAGIERH